MNTINALTLQKIQSTSSNKCKNETYYLNLMFQLLKV